MTTSALASAWRVAAAPALLYAIVAGLWILLSDRAAVWLARDSAELAMLSEYKGLAFVAVTGLLLFGALLREERRRRAQASLFAEVFENAPGGALIADRRGRVTRANLRLAELCGVEPSAIVGRTLDELVHADDAQASARDLARCVAGEIASSHAERRYRRADDTFFWASESIRALRDARGEPQHVIAIVDDVTERVEHDARVTRLNQMYAAVAVVNPLMLRRPPERELLQALCEAILHFDGVRLALALVLDSGGRTLDAAAQAGAIAPQWKSLQLPVDPDAARSPLPAVRATATGRTVVVNAVHEDPGLAEWHAAARESGVGALAAFPIAAGGRVIGALVVCSGAPQFFDADIVALLEQVTGDVGFGIDAQRRDARHREAEARLARTYRLLESIVGAMPDAVYAKDREGQYLLWSRGASAVTGRRSDDVIGRSDAQIFPADEVRIIRGFDRMVMASGRTLTFEESMETSQGRRTFLTVKGPLRDEAGDVVGLFGVARDITERVRHERELREARDELETRVLARTAELTAARDRAEGAERVKGAFLAAMSHELRTPLNAIIGFAGVLLQGMAGPLTAEQRKPVEIVRRSGEALLALIDDVLALTAIESGAAPLARDLVPIGPVLASVEAALSTRLERTRVRLRARPSDPALAALGDAARIEQVVASLARHAAAGTAEGTITLAAAGDDARVHVDVAADASPIDGGVSDAEARPPAPSTGGEPAPGDGDLSLAIARKLAVAMGGEIEVMRSATGSTYRLALPRASTRLPARAPTASEG